MCAGTNTLEQQLERLGETSGEPSLQAAPAASEEVGVSRGLHAELLAESSSWAAAAWRGRRKFTMNGIDEDYGRCRRGQSEPVSCKMVLTGGSASKGRRSKWRLKLLRDRTGHTSSAVT